MRASLDTAQDEKSCEPHAFFPLRGSHPGKKVLILGIRKKARFVDHLGERSVRIRKVRSSSLPSSTIQLDIQLAPCSYEQGAFSFFCFAKRYVILSSVWEPFIHEKQSVLRIKQY